MPSVRRHFGSNRVRLLPTLALVLSSGGVAPTDGTMAADIPPVLLKSPVPVEIKGMIVIGPMLKQMLEETGCNYEVRQRKGQNEPMLTIAGPADALTRGWRALLLCLFVCLV